MNIRLILLVILWLTLISCSAIKDREIRDIKDLPTFENYPVKNIYHGYPHAIVWSSHQNAAHFRTVIQDGYQKGPVLAGHFAYASAGCGTACQINWIIDVKTGRIMAQFPSIQGVQFRLNSRLIIIDPVQYAPNANACSPTDPMFHLYDKTIYLLINKNKIITLAKSSICASDHVNSLHTNERHYKIQK